MWTSQKISYDLNYYDPAVDHEKIKTKPDLITEKVLLETGLTEDKYLADSQSDEVKKQLSLGREFMNEYHETFQELAK